MPKNLPTTTTSVKHLIHSFENSEASTSDSHSSSHHHLSVKNSKFHSSATAVHATSHPHLSSSAANTHPFHVSSSGSHSQSPSHLTSNPKTHPTNKPKILPKPTVHSFPTDGSQPQQPVPDNTIQAYNKFNSTSSTLQTTTVTSTTTTTSSLLPTSENPNSKTHLASYQKFNNQTASELPKVSNSNSRAISPQSDPLRVRVVPPQNLISPKPPPNLDTHPLSPPQFNSVTTDNSIEFESYEQSNNSIDQHHNTPHHQQTQNFKNYIQSQKQQNQQEQQKQLNQQNPEQKIVENSNSKSKTMNYEHDVSEMSNHSDLIQTTQGSKNVNKNLFGAGGVGSVRSNLTRNSGFNDLSRSLDQQLLEKHQAEANVSESECQDDENSELGDQQLGLKNEGDAQMEVDLQDLEMEVRHQDLNKQPNYDELNLNNGDDIYIEDEIHQLQEIEDLSATCLYKM